MSRCFEKNIFMSNIRENIRKKEKLLEKQNGNNSQSTYIK